MFVDDPSNILSASDYASVNGVSSPLDVKVLVTSADSKPGLDMHVHDLVTSANTLAIGIDSVHRYTFTHFGTGTGISRGDYQGVARAGNGEFHAGNWAAGIRAIVNAANAASSEGQHGTVVVQEPTTVVEHPAAWPYLLGFGAMAVICLIAWRWMRRKSVAIEQAAQEARDETQEMRTRNIEEQGWHDKMAAKISAAPALASVPPVAGPRQAASRSTRPMPSPAPPRHRPAPSYAPAAVPIIVNQGTNDGLLAGLFIGESMGRPSVVEREVIHESPRYERDTGSDGGSSSSSFDSGSSSDSGSGGGGFDSGGGDGFDGGGGGGDF